MKNLTTISLLIFLSFAFGQAQSTKFKGVYYEVGSKANNKSFPVIIYLPDGYEKSKINYSVTFHLHGTNDNPITEKGVRNLVGSGQADSAFRICSNFYNTIIVVPLVGNHYYLDSPADSSIRIATFISKELVNYVESNFRTIKSRDARFLAGFSMGGYGVVSLLTKYPDVFSIAVSRGGVMDLAAGINDLDWDNVSPNIVQHLGPYWQNPQKYHLNGCYNLINKLANRKDVAIGIETGREDFLYKNNLKMRDRLKDKNIPHLYAEYPGGHVFNGNVIFSQFQHIQYLRNLIFYEGRR